MAELEAFSYSLSHDLRAPLRAIRGYSEILQARLADRISSPDVELLNRIQNSAHRMDDLIQDVLRYSRVVRGPVEFKAVDLEKVINGVIQDYPNLQPPKAEVAMQKPLANIVGHEALMTQCVSNLLSNAVKFTNPGTTPRIAIETVTAGKEVEVSFNDNGFGIPAGDQKRIFGIFNRLHHPQEIEGTGIGLAIVKKAVERMGGRVGVESEPGKGSRFWLRLPAAM
jgi:signal transduction histidine kinase